MNEKKTYSCSYSAEQNKELMKIRDKYTEPDEMETKLEQVRRLDASIYKRATALSVAIGIFGALLLGFGMSCIMVWADKMFIPGVIFGIFGIVIVAIAYPIYKFEFKNKHKEIAPIIIKLTDELLK